MKKRSSAARLAGDLDFFPIFDLLQWLEQAGKTGMLRIEGQDGERSVCIKNGRIIFASSRCKGERFGEFLASRGSLEEAVLRQALEASQREGITFTRFLIEREIVSRETLETAVFDLIQTILEGLFEENEPRMPFTFIDSLPSIVNEGVIQFQSAHLIMETVRRLDERRRDEERSDQRIAAKKEQLSRGEFEFPQPPELVNSLLRTPPDAWVDEMLAVSGFANGLQQIVRLGGLGGETGGGGPPAILERLGPRGSVGVLLALGFRELIPAENNADRIHLVLKHCIESAFIAYGLAQGCGQNPGEAFLGGLMHELGKAVILNLKSSVGMSEEALNLFLTETHLTVGGIVAERWGLSREVQASVRYQYNFRMAGSYRKVAALCQLSHSLASNPEGGGKLRFDAEAARFLGLEQALGEALAVAAVRISAEIA